MTDVTNEQARTVRDMIEPAIMKAGGWVNTHAHADRAFTLSPEILEMRRTCTLQQKWDALDRLKAESTEEDFYRRFSLFFELMIKQGCKACATFVDIDPLTQDRAIKAGWRAREHYKDQITVKFANQTLILRPVTGLISALRWSTSSGGCLSATNATSGVPPKLLTFCSGPPKRRARWCTRTWTSSISQANTRPRCLPTRRLSTACRGRLLRFTVFQSAHTPRCTVSGSTAS